jgi:hypothetical protein
MRRSVTWLVRILSCSDWRLTCENGGFEQLNELVDLDERVDSHLQISAVHVSIYGIELRGARNLQYLEEMIRLLVGLSKQA